MALFKVEYIRIPKDYLSPKRMRAMILNAMIKEGDSMVKDLNSTTEHWVHKPHFVKHMRYSGGDIILSAGLTGTAISNKYWNYVDKGTLRRYVVFNPQYSPKSQYPGSFYTNTPGSHTGKDKIIGRTFTAQRGIRARNWTILLRNKHKIPFARAIVEAIQKGLQPK
jgi:hypothetical protein